MGTRVYKLYPVETNRIYDELESHGVTVVEVDGLERIAAGYDHATKRVLVQRGLTARHLHATLLHELLHVRAGHEGCQPTKVEHRINEEVALTLVDPRAYVEAERTHGWNSEAIAVELDLPPFVVRAYRRVIEKRFARMREYAESKLLSAWAESA